MDTCFHQLQWLSDHDIRIFFFFCQAEDGIRDHCVTGVQTCALPIFKEWPLNHWSELARLLLADSGQEQIVATGSGTPREQERLRVLAATVENKRLLLAPPDLDRKSTRLNSSHTVISYAVFCLKKKTK